MFIYMYSILGMILFGYVKRNGLMNDYINFENFSNAFITLFVIATGDSWNFTTMAFTLEKRPSTGCLEDAGYDEYVSNGH